MTAIDDLQRISVLRDRAANACIKVTSGSEDLYCLALRMVGTGGDLQIAPYGLHAVVCTFRAEIMRMIILRLEAQMRELLPAAQDELDEMSMGVAEAAMRGPAPQAQGAESAEERQVT